MATNSQGTAETREDRFWRLLDGKLGRYADRLWLAREPNSDDDSRLIINLRKLILEAREESKEGK